jgi:hypothetical protein
MQNLLAVMMRITSELLHALLSDLDRYFLAQQPHAVFSTSTTAETDDKNHTRILCDPFPLPSRQMSLVIRSHFGL